VPFDLWWQAQGMLDNFSVHIGDVKRPIRPVAKLHGPKPNIGGGQELRLLIHPMAQVRHTIWLQLLAMQQIAPHIGN
jgi:hypothetical protein